MDGSGRRVIAPSPESEDSPAWAADGRRIAFVSNRSGDPQVYVASASGRGVRRLTEAKGFSDDDPAWSPDGRKIVFVRHDVYGTEFLYTINADGSGLRFLFEASSMCCPDFSPDGRRIALSVNGEIVVVDANGKGRRLVSGAGTNTSPSWSPDGRSIVFDSDRDDDWEIFVVPARGGPVTQLTDNDVDDEWPDWSPDGQLIAFSRGDLLELEGSLYLMRPNGSRQRRVPLQVPAAMPSWQPSRELANGLAAEGGELAAVALELLTLGGDDLGRGVRDEALVREHSLCPRDLLAETLQLGVAIAVDPRALGADHRSEDAPLVVGAELDLDAAPAEDLGGLLHAVERSDVVGEAGIRLRPWRHDQPDSRSGSCDQISSVTCGMTGCRSASSRSSAASAVAAASPSSSYSRGLIASAYQSQKSSNVRW